MRTPTEVMDTLTARGERIEWCVVGEPSSTRKLGDLVKNGRRGSLNATLVIHGKQGHIAYPHLAENPIHRALSALDALVNEPWDAGNDFFDPTSLQISTIQAGQGVTNVIPGSLRVLFNLRFSTEITADAIRDRCETILNQYDLRYDLEWSLSGEPFLTVPGALVLNLACSRGVCACVRERVCVWWRKPMSRHSLRATHSPQAPPHATHPRAPGIRQA